MSDAPRPRDAELLSKTLWTTRAKKGRSPEEIIEAAVRGACFVATHDTSTTLEAMVSGTCQAEVTK